MRVRSDSGAGGCSLVKESEAAGGSIIGGGVSGGGGGRVAAARGCCAWRVASSSDLGLEGADFSGVDVFLDVECSTFGSSDEGFASGAAEGAFFGGRPRFRRAPRATFVFFIFGFRGGGCHGLNFLRPESKVKSNRTIENSAF